MDRNVGAVIYIDTNLNAQMFLDTSTYDLSNSRNAKIGINDVVGDEPFEGIIDDVRIYDRALTEEDVRTLYHLIGWMNCPENVNISISTGNLNLNWNSVPGATSYKVFSNTNPY